MRIVVQRVRSASVTNTESGKVISSIGPGLVALVGLHNQDTIEDVHYCAQRILACKLWSNDNDKPWRQSVKQRNFDCLCVSQFTLYGTLTKKHQPDYKLALSAEPAHELYNKFLAVLRQGHDKIHDGQFGAMMDVALVNDGPVTLVIESRNNDGSAVGKDQGVVK